MHLQKTRVFPPGPVVLEPADEEPDFYKDKNGVLLMRTEKGSFVTTSPHEGLWDMVEGNVWSTLTNGTRLPKPLVQSTIYHEVPDVDYMPEKVYRSTYPKRTCQLWRDEERTGQMLISAGELRDTIPAYKDLEPLIEYGEEGWTPQV